MNDDPATAPTSIVEHSTCLACGCLCDDIRVVVEEARIVEAGNACPIGREWFLAPRPGEGLPIASIDGRPAGLDEAIDGATEILRAARAPVIWGLSRTTNEAVASALAIGDRIGAVVDLAGSSEASGKLAAIQRVGLVSASLGEVKDRADVVVFWGVNPLVTHPRHWERYSVEPRGRFVPEGRAGRFVIVVDEEPSESSRAADLFVRVAHDRQPETLAILRALVKGVKLDPDRAARSAGLPFAQLEELADRLKQARYGAFFFGPDLNANDLGAMAIEPALTLVRDLNDGRRFVAMELGHPGNSAGASAVLTWQTGASSAVDFSLGYPRHLPGEATLMDRMARREVDVVLIVADDPWDVLPIDQVVAGLENVPLIVIAPADTDLRERPSTIVFDVARPGIEAGGTVSRVDGVMLPLRPAITSSLPTDRDILEAIGRRLGNLS
jgi:formylmethanofuran dehydrogenase subunit B